MDTVALNSQMQEINRRLARIEKTLDGQVKLNPLTIKALKSLNERLELLERESHLYTLEVQVSGQTTG